MSNLICTQCGTSRRAKDKGCPYCRCTSDNTEFSKENQGSFYENLLAQQEVIFKTEAVKRWMLSSHTNCQLSITKDQLIFDDFDDESYSFIIPLGEFKKAKIEKPRGFLGSSDDVLIILENGEEYEFGLADGVKPKALKILRDVLREQDEKEPSLEGVFAKNKLNPPAQFRNDLEKAIQSEQHYQHSRNLNALKQAIAAWERILNDATFEQANESFRLTVWNCAGGTYLKSYERQNRLIDLDNALRLLQKAVDTTQEEDPELPISLSNLGQGLRTRFHRSGHIGDLQKSIRICEQAVDTIAEGHPLQPLILVSLGQGLSARFRLSRHIEDLQEAIRIYQQAVETTPAGHPNLPDYLSLLGSMLSDRYRQIGRIEDLQKAISVFQQAVDSTPKGHPDLAGHFSRLGVGLNKRYDCEGRSEDLQKAIRFYQQAVDITPEGHPSLPEYLSNLGNGLSIRYSRSGRIEDLQEAIHTYQIAVENSPEDYPSILNNLSNGLSARYNHSGQLEDLQEAIHISQQAVGATSKDHPDLPSMLSNLGNKLYSRYNHSGQLEDLQEAIRISQQAVDTTPERHPDLPGHLNNLGVILSARYNHSKQLEDLQDAVRISQQAVDTTPERHPDLPGHLNNLGVMLSARYNHSKQLEDLRDAIRVYQHAVQTGRESNLKEAQSAGRNWLLFASNHHIWDEVLQAYDTLIQVFETRKETQFIRKDKIFSVREIQGLPSLAAYAAVQKGDLVKAVEILEQSRGRLMREVLERQRKDLHALEHTTYTAFYEEYIHAARYVKYIQSIPFEQRPPRWGTQRLQAQQVLDEAVQAIREKIPGFEHFLQSLPFAKIQQQATDAPLIYLTATKHGGLALIVHNEGEPQVVHLPFLTAEHLQQRAIGTKEKPGYLVVYSTWQRDTYQLVKLQAWKEILDKTLHWFWDVVMAEIIQSLELAGLERDAIVRLIPCGMMGFFPLHAAWVSDESMPNGRRYALDAFTFTYTPSAQTLTHSSYQIANNNNMSASILAVEFPDERFHFASQAVQAALALFDEDKQKALIKEKATEEAVCDAFADYDVLYFFTHGRAAFYNPLESGIQMAGQDKWLTLKKIFDLRTDHARLAILSACETGILSDLKTMDEVVSLPSGLIQAGVPGVVSSLWTVLESSTAVLMTIFFMQWRIHGLPPQQALRAAQQIVRDAQFRSESKIFFEQYSIPEDVVQDFNVEMMIQDFDHPFYWAAFTYTGL